jgi:hypothetical protein
LLMPICVPFILYYYYIVGNKEKFNNLISI